MQTPRKILFIKVGHRDDVADAARSIATARVLGGRITLAEFMPDHDQVADLFRGERLRELAALFPGTPGTEIRYRLLGGDLPPAAAGAAPEFDLVIVTDGRTDSSQTRRELAELLRTVPTPIWLGGGSGIQAPRRILAAVDVMTSDIGKRRLNRPILEHALALAGRFEADLDVLSVVHPAGPTERLFARLGAEPAPNPGAESTAERRLRALVEEVRSDLGAADAPPPRLVVAGGNAAELLVHGIDAASIDLLVAGHLGRRGLSAWLFGNTVEILRAELDCSILAVKTPATEDGKVEKSQRVRAA